MPPDAPSWVEGRAIEPRLPPCKCSCLYQVALFTSNRRRVRLECSSVNCHASTAWCDTEAEAALLWRGMAMAAELLEHKPGAAQGLCETTKTPRFFNPSCACATYEGNAGPCRTFEESAVDDHCVYCDHNAACHASLLAAEKTDAP